MPKIQGHLAAWLILMQKSPPLASTRPLQHVLFVVRTSQTPQPLLCRVRAAWHGRSGKLLASGRVQWSSQHAAGSVLEPLRTRDVPYTSVCACEPVAVQGLGLEQILSRDRRWCGKTHNSLQLCGGRGMALSLSHRNAAPATSSGTNSLFWLELSLCLGEQAVTPLYQWMKAIRLVCIRKAWRRSQEMPAHTVQGYCSPKPYPAVMPPLNQTTQTQRMVCTYSGSCLHVQAATGYLQVI